MSAPAAKNPSGMPPDESFMPTLMVMAHEAEAGAATVAEKDDDKKRNSQVVLYDAGEGPTLFRNQSDDYEETKVRLMDVNLIVVGQGQEAVELVRRRRADGGRVMLLWTDRLPARDAPPPDRSSLLCDMSSFYWNPPPYNKPSQDARVKKLRKTFKSSQVGFARYGADVVSLDPEEQYEMLTNSAGEACGVCVYEGSKGEVVWKMSGCVVFAGAGFEARADAVLSMAEAKSVDVEVVNKEAQAFSTVDPIMFCWLSLYYGVAWTFISFGFIKWESGLTVEQYPFWRSFIPLHFAFFGAGLLPDIVGHAMSGVRATTVVVLLGAVAAPICFGLYAATPLRFAFATTHTWSAFSMCVLATATYFLFGIPAYIWWCWRRVKSMIAQGEKRFAWKAHAVWSFYLAFGSYGAWMVMFCVAFVYLMMSRAAPGVAAMALPIMTDVVEAAFSWGASRVFTVLVHNPRARSSSRSVVFGDQRRHLISVPLYAHAYAEGTRLASLLADVTFQGGNTWMVTLVFAFFTNLFQRAGWMPWLQATLLPRRVLKIVKPGMAKMMHAEAKYCMGYPRFVGIVPFFLGTYLAKGSFDHPFFNSTVLSVLALAFVLEVIEDSLLTWSLVPVHPWRTKFLPLFKEFGALSPLQLFAVDCEGVHGDRSSLNMHGMCFLNVRNLGCVCGVTSIFGYCLLSLLVGAGFIADACPAPLAERFRLYDSIFWEIPLKCA